MRISPLPSMAVDSSLQVCFYEEMSLESKKPKLCWKQRGSGPLSSSDIQEITLGSSPGTWVSQDPPKIKRTECVQERGLLKYQEGWLVGANTNFYGAAKLVVDATANSVLASLWLLALSRTRGDWQHQQTVTFLLKELCHLKKEELIQ